MISLENIFKNHFDSARISDDNLAKFAQDHLARLRAAQNHAFDDLMAETESVYLAYAGSVSGEDLRTVQRISATRSTDDLLQDFKAEVSRQEGLIRSLFGKDTPEYLLFFPQGATEYANAVKANVQTLMDRMADLMQAHAQTILPDVVSRFVTLRNDYVRQLKAQDYAYLAEIARTKQLLREDEQAAMPERHPLYFRYALEYLDDDGAQWVDVHPLIVETEGFRRAYKKREAITE